MGLALPMKTLFLRSISSSSLLVRRWALSSSTVFQLAPCADVGPCRGSVCWRWERTQGAN